MIRYFAAHPTAANLLMLFLVVIGLASLTELRRETFPDFTASEVQVAVPYPGASAAQVEEAICLRLEDAIDGVTDVAEMRCESREGQAMAIVEMSESGDFARFLDDVKTEVDAIDNFPDVAEDPIVTQLGRTDQVVSIAVTGPMPVTDLKAYAEGIKDALQRLAEVSRVEVTGFSQRQLRVEPSAAALRARGLGVSDIATAITRQSVDLPAGSIETAERELLVRFSDQRRTARELEDLIVIGAGGDGSEVRLGDIATVTDLFERAETLIRFDGRRAALLQVTRTKTEDALVVVEAVKAFVERERLVAPPGVRLTLTQDVASIVEDRLRMLLTNGWQGLVLVFAVMALFFRFRFAFWVAAGLPVSFLGGLFLMALFGYTVNMISMVALLIALGLLMDDAIVIAENIATHLRGGKGVLDAVVDGTTEVFPGVLSSFLTTVAIFAPLAFLSGDIGNVLEVLPVVLIMVLSISLVEAFLILPAHLSHALAHHAGDTPGTFRRRFDAGVEWVRHEVLGRAVDAVIAWRYLFVGLVLAAFLGSVGMVAGGRVGFQAFPEIDGDIVQARVLLPQGTPLARTESIVARLIGALEAVNAEFTPRQPDGEALVRTVSVQFDHNPDAGESGPHLATVTGNLLTAEVRDARVDDVLNRWRELAGDVPDVISLNFKEPAIGPAGRPIDIRIAGDDLGEVAAASTELQGWLGRFRGVLDLTDDLRAGKPELRVRLREGSLALGLDAATVARQVRDAFAGTTADEVQVGAESYEIDVRLPASDRASPGNLEDFRIVTAARDQVPLAAVAEITSARGYSRINRVDARRTVTITGDVDARVTNAQRIIALTREDFLPGLLDRHPGVSVELEGEAAESAATGASLARGLAVGLVGIFILLSFQFRSYIEPAVVMIAIPLALIGVIWGHVVMGLDLTMPSMMGAVSLSGIVVNDSILLVAFLKARVAQGHAVHDAARMASRERFRAILLTSLTTIAGLLPILSEKSLQAQVLIPLVTSIAFGLLASTLLVLLVVPALYTILEDFGLARANEPESPLPAARSA